MFRKRHSRRLRRRLSFEQLEDRRLLTAIVWTGASLTDANDWNDTANWDLGRLPTTGDDVSIPDVAATSEVLLERPSLDPGAGSFSFHSLVSDEALRIESANVTVPGTIQVNNQLTIWAGATINDATIQPGNGGSVLVIDGSHLSNLTINADVNTYKGSGYESFAVDNLTLNGKISLDTHMTMRFVGGDQHLAGSGEVVGDAVHLTPTYSPQINIGGPFTVTVDPGITIRPINRGLNDRNIAIIGAGGATLVNQGTIRAPADTFIAFNGYDSQGWTIRNEGLMEAVDGATIYYNRANIEANTLINTSTGVVRAVGGSLINDYGNTTAAGTFLSDGSVINIGSLLFVDSSGHDHFSALTPQPGLDLQTDNGGRIDLADVAGAGQTVSLNNTNGRVYLHQTWDGGTIDGTSPLYALGNLKNVLINTDIVASPAAYGPFFENITALNGVITINSGSRLVSNITQTLPGTGEIDFHAIPYTGLPHVDIPENTTLTLAPGITVRGVGRFNGIRDLNAGSLINQGTISPGEPGGTIEVSGTYTQDSSGALDVSIGGVGASDYGALWTDDSTTLGGDLNVSFAGGFTPSAGQSFLIVNKLSDGAIAGAFAGLPEGTVFNAGGVPLQITYAGNTGNDVVLTVVSSNEAPDTPVDSDATANAVAEGAAAGTMVGITAQAGDPNGDAVTYALTNDGGGWFDIDANTGVVTVANGALLDGPATRTITVEAADPSGATSTADFTIMVNNVAPTVSLNAVATIDENDVATLTGDIVDPGTLDTFTLVVDWGDPLSPNNVETYTFSASSSGTQPFTLTHQYLDDNPSGTSSDRYTVNVSVADDGGGTSADVPFGPAGAEFRVNTTTAGDQILFGDTGGRAVAVDDAGNSVVVWTSDGQDGSSSGVYAQRYDANGNTVGGEFQVNTHTYNPQTTPSVAMDSAGNFVVTWMSYLQDGSSGGVYAQRYDAGGNTVGGEFQVNTYTSSSQSSPSVAMDSAGNFVVTWQSYGQDGSGLGVYAQRYDAGGNTVGGEFQVNSYTNSYQSSPSVAMDSSGNFVVTWTSFGQDGSSDGVYAQRYDANGNTIGGEFRVNSYTNLGQSSPSVAMDSAGNFVVAWMSYYHADGSNWDVYAQRYDAGGNTVGGEFQVNTYTSSSQSSPSVAMDSAGNFVVTWMSDGQDGSGRGVYAQRYDAIGNTVGGEFQVTTVTSNDQWYPSVAMDSAGNFVVTWESLGQDGSGWGVYAQRYNGGFGAARLEVTVNNVAPQLQNVTVTSPINQNDVATLTGDIVDPGTLDTFTMVVDWGDGSAVQTFNYAAGTTSFSETHLYLDDNPSGTSSDTYTVSVSLTDDDGGTSATTPFGPAGAEFRVNTTTASNQLLFGETGGRAVAVDDAGNSVVVWSSYNQDSGGWGVYAQRYDAGGNTLGGEFQVNTVTTSDQLYPSVAIDSAGNFVVTWSSLNQDGSGWGVYAQRYDAGGNTVGGEFQVNTYTSSHQWYPSVAMESAGNFVVTWISYGQDGGYSGVYAQRYDANGNTVGGEFQVNPYTSSNQSFPSVAMDNAGNFVVTWTSNGHDGSGRGVFAQRYDANGIPLGGEFQVNTYTNSEQSRPSVAMDSGGNFVVTWVSDGQDGSGRGVYAQRYDAIGNPLGGEFQVNTYTSNNQWYPSVAMDSAGNFVVAWSSLAQDGSGYGVYAQRYDAGGNAVGGEFQVNSYPFFDQSFPSVAMDSAGNFVVTWQSYGQDGSGWGVYAQRYNGGFGPALLAVTVNNVDHSPTADAGGPYTIDEGNSLVLDASGSTDPDGDSLSYRWDVDGDGDFDESITGATPTITAAQMAALGLGDGPDSRTVTVEVSDGVNSSTAQTSLTINNVAPTLVLDPVAAIDENGAAVLTGTIGDPGTLDNHDLTIDWDDPNNTADSTFNVSAAVVLAVDDTFISTSGDGAVLTVTGLTADTVSFSVEHQYADDGPAPGNGLSSDTSTIVVTVSDDDTGTGSGDVDLLVQNVAPILETVGVIGLGNRDNKALPGQAIRLDGTFSDVGTLDGHTVVIDWGEISDTAPNAADDRTTLTFAAGDVKKFSETHAYSTGGIFRITVTVIDDDTGTAVNDSTEVFVTGVRTDPSTGELQIVGTSGKDIVVVKEVGGEGGGADNAQIKVVANFDVQNKGGSDRGSDSGADVFLFDLDTIDAIRIVLCAGDDHAVVGSDGGGLDIPTLIEGDAGNDYLTGGVGDDIILGGAGDDYIDGRGGNDALSGGGGNDKLNGGMGDDVVIGGTGKDDLKGGKGDDLLIAGVYVEEDNIAALESVLAEWTRDDIGYEAMLDHLTGDIAGGLNGAFVLNSATLADDGAKDTLNGQQGLDAFFAMLAGSDKDTVKDHRREEEILPIS